MGFTLHSTHTSSSISGLSLNVHGKPPRIHPRRRLARDNVPILVLQIPAHALTFFCLLHRLAIVLAPHSLETLQLLQCPTRTLVECGLIVQVALAFALAILLRHPGDGLTLQGLIARCCRHTNTDRTLAKMGGESNILLARTSICCE